MRLYDDLFSTPEMIEVLSDAVFVEKMLKFEVALAAALEENGIIFSGTACAIEFIEANSFDMAALMGAAAPAGNICIPFVKMLTAKIAASNAPAAAYVHWSATSQDVIDTSLILQIRRGFLLLQRDLTQTCDALAKLVAAHRRNLMAGRT